MQSNVKFYIYSEIANNPIATPSEFSIHKFSIPNGLPKINLNNNYQKKIDGKFIVYFI